LSQQIDDLRAKVATSENEVEKYRSDNGLLKGANTTISKQQLTEINSQIAVADSAKAEAQAKADEINRLLKAGGRLDVSSEVLSSTLVQALREQEVQAERKVAELSATYLPGHPKMIAAMKELDGIMPRYVPRRCVSRRVCKPGEGCRPARRQCQERPRQIEDRSGHSQFLRREIAGT